jgi:hypothetical protein
MIAEVDGVECTSVDLADPHALPGDLVEGARAR